MNEISLNLTERTRSIPLLKLVDDLLSSYYKEYPLEVNDRKELLYDVYALINDIFNVFGLQYSDEDKLLIANYIYSLKGNIVSLQKLFEFINNGIDVELSYDYILRDQNKIQNDNDGNGAFTIINVSDKAPLSLIYPTSFLGINDFSCHFCFKLYSIYDTACVYEGCSEPIRESSSVMTSIPSWAINPSTKYVMEGTSVYDEIDEQGNTTTTTDVYSFNGNNVASGTISTTEEVRSPSTFSKDAPSGFSSATHVDSCSCSTTFNDGSTTIYTSVTKKSGNNTYYIKHETKNITPDGSSTVSACKYETYTITSSNKPTVSSKSFNDFTNCWKNAKNLSISQNKKIDSYSGANNTSVIVSDEVIENYCLLENGYIYVETYTENNERMISCGEVVTYYSQNMSSTGQSIEFNIEEDVSRTPYKYVVDPSLKECVVIRGGEFLRDYNEAGCRVLKTKGEEPIFNNYDWFSVEENWCGLDLSVRFAPKIYNQDGSICVGFLTYFRENYSGCQREPSVNNISNVKFCTVTSNRRPYLSFTTTMSDGSSEIDNLNYLLKEVNGYDYAVDARKVTLNISQVTTTNKTRLEMLLESLIQDLIFVTKPSITESTDGYIRTDGDISISINNVKYNVDSEYTIENSYTNRLVSNSIPTSYFLNKHLLWSSNS